MRRQTVRLRQEFLERKGNEGVREAIHLRKQQLRDAMEHMTPLPGHLKKDATNLKKFVELDDDETKELRTTIDDEYANAGVEDPRILVTTSREPSGKLMEFVKEVRLMIPNATRLNRGGTPVTQIMDIARRESFTDVIVIGESKGVPDSLTISHLPIGPTIVFTIHNLVTRHEIEDCGPMSLQYPHLIFENFQTAHGKRVASILKYLFPVPKPEATRVCTFDNVDDYISFRHHTFEKKGKKTILTEVGPRFELQPYRIVLGTLEMEDAETEWVLRPYMNTAKKRRLM